jgi:ParB-like chromosome segregation protein Spo0J
MTNQHAAIGKDPIDTVAWISRDELRPNHYNPNKVAPPELELLVVSILEDGWTQPIVALEDGTIVDGFHRYLVSADPRLLERYQGWVPVVRVNIDPVHRMMSTIRHNRARGTHGVLPMANIVRTIAEDGVTTEEIMARLQMEPEEVDRLMDRAGMTVRATKEHAAFSPAWVPRKNPTDTPVSE